MDSDLIARAEAMLEGIALSAPWFQCGANDGRCTCGMIWSAPSHGVVAIAQSSTNSGTGDGFIEDMMQRHAAFIAAAPALVADLLAALRAAGRAPRDGAEGEA